MEITNYEIEDIESKIIELRDEIIKFKVRLEYDGRTDENYNHLGTLSVNSKVLESHLKRLIEVLDY